MRNEPLDFWPEEPLFCGRCGTTIAADDLFCPHCGQKIERRAASPGWGWYIGLILLAIALFLCILGIGTLGAYHGLEERHRLNRGATLITTEVAFSLPVEQGPPCVAAIWEGYPQTFLLR